MRNIDLVPNAYREGRKQRRFLVRSAVGSGMAVAALLLVYGFLRVETNSRIEQAADLRAQNALTQRQQEELEVLVERRNEFLRQLSVLQGLRAGAAVSDIFTIVDNAIVPGKVWFTDWSFHRSGIVVNGRSSDPETGSFVVVGNGGDTAASDDLEVETHMSIRGQAVDHRALSAFVRRLYSQNHVRDVNVRRTAQVVYSASQVVDFDLTVILTSEASS